MLVVEDDDAQAALCTMTLESAGIVAERVERPERILETLVEGSPDLILVDLSLPDLDGLDLVRVVRQHARTDGVPIIALTAERRPARIVEALAAGTDGFLTKPVEARELVRAVVGSASRYRALRALLTRDSLSGLFNHNRMEDALATELQRARRSHEPLSVATIDIDSFKSINDRAGHAEGDRTIVRLARLLKKRLRSSDVIGRIGGDEFQVIMPGANGAAAMRVLDEVREQFADSSARSGSPATFSCGISSLPTSNTVEALREHSDAALYEAKERGRNQVCCHLRLNGRRALVVDDDPFLAALVGGALLAAGYQVMRAANGREALDMVTAERPDIVISDLLIPGLHGFDLCRAIKSSPATSETPVLLMTGVYVRFLHLTDAMGCGAAHLFRKPVDLSQLVATADSLLGLTSRVAPEGPLLVAMEADAGAPASVTTEAPASMS